MCSNYARMCFGVSPVPSKSPRSKTSGRSRRHDSCAVNDSCDVNIKPDAEDHSRTDLLKCYSNLDTGDASPDNEVKDRPSSVTSMNSMVKDRPSSVASLNSMVKDRPSNVECANSMVKDRSPNVDGNLNNIMVKDRSSSVDSSSTEESIGNRIMVVVDSSLEAKGALEWALSHTAQTNDTILLLHLANAADTNEKFDGLKAFELLHSLKNLCQISKSGLQVEVALAEIEPGKDKGQKILEEAKKQMVSLLVLGQERKRSTWWQLGCSGGVDGVGEAVVEYCIQNAACMTVAVRKKNSNGGGYLISTKLHKNFWLLA